MAKKENKKTLIDLINQIDQKKQELKQLKKDYLDLHLLLLKEAQEY